MKIIEFICKKEGEALSNALLTIGKFDAILGYYISFCVFRALVTRYDLCFDSLDTGWCLYRVNILLIKPRNGKWKVVTTSGWSMVNRVGRITREYMMGRPEAYKGVLRREITKLRKRNR